MSDKEDLEDGEIEDDEEEMSVDVPPAVEPATITDPKPSPQQTPTKPKQVERSSGSVEDDWATNVEKAMANALIKAGVEPPLPNITVKETEEEEVPIPKSRKRRKPKSERKNKDNKPKTSDPVSNRVEIFNPKRQKINEDGEEYGDEYEMLNVRGGSPPPVIALDDDSTNASSDGESYDSDEYRKMSYEERRQKRREQSRKNRRDRSKERDDRRRDRDRRDRERDRNDDHYERREPRKLEICKFYLLDCCAKRDKCSYLHSEFPCKYYYLGMKCPTKDCKLNHGKPLSDQFRGILLKHLETAPREIMGNFPRLGRDKALELMDAQHLKLLAKERSDKDAPETLSNTPNIPSLLDTILPKRNTTDNRPRRSRWHDMTVPPAPTLPNIEQKPPIPEYMSIKNMSGILTAKQINELLEMGIESVEQIKQLTLAQMDKLGLTITQITEIQSNVQNMEKVLKETKVEKRKSPERTVSVSPPTAATVINQDLDLRIAPMSVAVVDEPPPALEVQDVDLRVLPTTASSLTVSSLSNVPITSSAALQALDHAKDSDEQLIDPQKLQDFRNMFGPGSGSSSLVDFSQYLKDAHMKDTEEADNEISSNRNTAQDEPNSNQDEESELQIDESWYSDDEEKDKSICEEIKEETKVNDSIMSPVHTQESIIATLKELEKAKQKEEKAKVHETAQTSALLPATYNPAIESTFSSFYEPPKSEKSFPDPRTRRISNEIKSPSLSDSTEESVVKRTSIYDQQSDGENDDYEYVSKKTDKDMRIAALDTDLTTGDIDLRLPFKPILAPLMPASEINGSIDTHRPIDYKLVEIEVPKPTFRELKHSKTASTENIRDPRLVRLLGIKSSSSRERRDSRSSDYSSSATPRSPDPVPNKPAPRLDPRRRKEELTQAASTMSISSPNSNTIGGRDLNQLDMQGLMMLLQKSGWYQQLNSNSKISVNQTLARLSGEIKKFHQDPSTDKVFDLTFVTSDPFLQQILNSLGVYLNENGYFCHVDDTPKNNPPPILPNLSQPPPGTLPMNLQTGIDLNVLNSLGSLLNQQARPFIQPPRPSLLGMPPPLLTNPLLNESVLGAMQRGLLPPPMNIPPPLIGDNFNGNRNQGRQQQDHRGNWNNSRRNNDYRSDPRRNRN